MYKMLLNYMGHGSVDMLPPEYLSALAHLAVLHYRSSSMFISRERALRLAGLPPRLNRDRPSGSRSRRDGDGS